MLWREGVEAVIAIGGGSVIDAAKVASVIASGGGGFKDVFRGRRPRNMMPLIAINLTHETGTEIDRYAVLTTDDTREKHGLNRSFGRHNCLWEKSCNDNNQVRRWKTYYTEIRRS
jgi:alcohol dehydrogenase